MDDAVSVAKATFLFFSLIAVVNGSLLVCQSNQGPWEDRNVDSLPVKKPSIVCWLLSLLDSSNLKP